MLFWALLLGTCSTQPQVQPSVVSRPTKRSTLQTTTKRIKDQQGSGVDINCSLYSLETKAPKEGAETVAGGRVFQSLAVLGKHELRRLSERQDILSKVEGV